MMLLIYLLLLSLNLWANYLLKAETKMQDKVIAKQRETINIWKQAHSNLDKDCTNEVRMCQFILKGSQNALDLCKGGSIQGK